MYTWISRSILTISYRSNAIPEKLVGVKKSVCCPVRWKTKSSPLCPTCLYSRVVTFRFLSSVHFFYVSQVVLSEEMYYMRIHAKKLKWCTCESKVNLAYFCSTSFIFTNISLEFQHHWMFTLTLSWVSKYHVYPGQMEIFIQEIWPQRQATWKPRHIPTLSSTSTPAALPRIILSTFLAFHQKTLMLLSLLAFRQKTFNLLSLFTISDNICFNTN